MGPKIIVKSDTLTVERNRGKLGTDFAQVIVVDERDWTKRQISIYAVRSRAHDPIHVGDWGVEIYQGPNYIAPFDSKEKSYSRHYKYANGLPEKYQPVVNWLKYKLEPLALVNGRKFSFRKVR